MYIRIIFTVLLLSALPVALSSCQEDELTIACDLEVYISGTLSGVPREGISVTLYLTKANADADVHPVTDTYETDVDGLVYFLNIDSGISYWVRAETLLLHHLRQTKILQPGINEFKMTVL